MPQDFRWPQPPRSPLTAGRRSSAAQTLLQQHSTCFRALSSIPILQLLLPAWLVCLAPRSCMGCRQPRRLPAALRRRRVAVIQPRAAGFPGTYFASCRCRHIGHQAARPGCAAFATVAQSSDNGTVRLSQGIPAVISRRWSQSIEEFVCRRSAGGLGRTFSAEPQSPRSCLCDRSDIWWAVFELGDHRQVRTASTAVA
jgi:hypothetical protein